MKKESSYFGVIICILGIIFGAFMAINNQAKEMYKLSNGDYAIIIIVFIFAFFTLTTIKYFEEIFDYKVDMFVVGMFVGGAIASLFINFYNPVYQYSLCSYVVGAIIGAMFNPNFKLLEDD